MMGTPDSTVVMHNFATCAIPSQLCLQVYALLNVDCCGATKSMSLPSSSVGMLDVVKGVTSMLCALPNEPSVFS